MKNVLITGSGGFLGKNLLALIKKKNLRSEFNFLTPDSKKLNLLDSNSVASYVNQHLNIDSIIHLAAICGGIGLNKKAPADLTHLNNKMTVNLFDALRSQTCRSYFIGMGSVCSFGKFCPTPFKEDDIWNSGKSEETNRGYGEAKKMMITEFQSHHEQYDLKGLILVSTNMFGYHDSFDNLKDNHVIPALINKFTNAVDKNLPEVFCWGDGSATRDFIFCESVCEAILMCLENKLDYYEPINIGSGKDISIKNLTELIAKLTGFTGKIIFTGEVSNGQPKRLLDISRAKNIIGWEPDIDLENELIKTLEWYKESKVTQ